MKGCHSWQSPIPRSSETTWSGSPGTVKRVWHDFGIHPMTLSKWLRRADVDAGTKTGVTTAEATENRDLRRRVKLLEQENEVLRRAAAYLSQANLDPKGSSR